MMQKREIERGADGCLLWIGLLTVVSLLVTSAPVTGASSSDQALRERVQELYSTLQRGDWRHAEKYLTKDSKPIFRNQPKKPLMGFEIKSTKLEASGESAVVVVAIPLLYASSPKPLSVPETTHWRLVNGNWYLQLSLPSATESPGGVGMASSTRPPAPPPSPLSKDLKFTSTRVSIGYVHKGEVKDASFTFTNVSARAVTVSLGQTSCDCLRMKSQEQEVKPGEAGAVEFELDPSTLNFDAQQALILTVLLKTEPENALTRLTILAVLTPDSGGASPPPVAPPPLPRATRP